MRTRPEQRDSNEENSMDEIVTRALLRLFPRVKGLRVLYVHGFLRQTRKRRSIVVHCISTLVRRTKGKWSLWRLSIPSFRLPLFQTSIQPGHLDADGRMEPIDSFTDVNYSLLSRMKDIVSGSLICRWRSFKSKVENWKRDKFRRPCTWHNRKKGEFRFLIKKRSF